VHVQNVNAYHARFRQWLSPFTGRPPVIYRIIWAGAGCSTPGASFLR